MAQDRVHRGRTALVLFTRTAQTENKPFGLGQRANQRLAQTLVQRTLQTIADAVSGDASVVLVTDGTLEPGPLAHLRQAGAEPLELLQHGESFEERFLGALGHLAGLGFDRLVAIGSDTPQLCAEDLRAALSSDPRELVVGPSQDGGFYLLGLPAQHLAALRGLPWQRPGLLAALLRRFEAVPQKLLPLRRDVDSARDVRALQPLLERLCELYLRSALSDATAGWRYLRRAPRPRASIACGAGSCRAPPRRRAICR